MSGATVDTLNLITVDVFDKHIVRGHDNDADLCNNEIVPAENGRLTSVAVSPGTERTYMLEKLRFLQKALQREKLQKFNRRVPWGDLVTDRWDNAREYGFGEGTSCYDSAVVLGDVKVGKHTWIGPNVLLDGLNASLVIGDYCAISAGAQIYTHDTVRWCVNLGRAAKMDSSPTFIGNGVYIGPNSIICRGVTVGDSAVVGAMSFVNKDIPARKKAWGCPAVVIGDVDSYLRN